VNLTDPASSVVPSLDHEVIAVLAGTTRPLTGREVHRLARRGSQSGVQRILTRMVASGLVTMTEAGSARLYVLNREHVAAEAVLELLDLRGRLFARIRAHLATWPIPPVAAAAFGSAARGDGGLDSDIDVFLVRPDELDSDDPRWTDPISQLAERIARWSGNSASFIEATPTQMRAMLDRDEPIIADIRTDAIPLTERALLDISAVTR
jgi:Nucleotidyltransferase domain